MRLLDEVCLAQPEVVAAAGDRLAGLLDDGIGAIVEYELFRRTMRPRLPALTCAVDDPIAVGFDRLVAGGSSDSTAPSMQPLPYDFMRIPTELRDDNGWVAFVQRARVSAREAGYSHDVASAVAGAIEELADNVVQHSRADGPAFAGFAKKSKRFEYVVADTGVGMLASLQECPEFRSLRDDLEALPLAIRSGISRKGRNSGCGYGFRAVFAPLRFASGYVRLRSGAAVLEIEGYGPHRDTGVCSQRHDYKGVIVSATLDCRQETTSP